NRAGSRRGNPTEPEGLAGACRRGRCGDVVCHARRRKRCSTGPKDWGRGPWERRSRVRWERGNEANSVVGCSRSLRKEEKSWGWRFRRGKRADRRVCSWRSPIGERAEREERWEREKPQRQCRREEPSPTKERVREQLRGDGAFAAKDRGAPRNR